MPFIYEYIDDTPRDFPTLGLREVAKGQRLESEEPLNSLFLKEIKPQTKSSVIKENVENNVV